MDAPASDRADGDIGTTYTVRVTLDETSPPLWRRVEVASSLTLDAVHEVIQVVVGWTDSHLHRFASPPEHHDRTRYYLSPFDLADGDDGTPDEQVRLGEVLSEVGDRLHYQYDYGDDWWHTLELEDVGPRHDDQPYARCTDGDRPGPPEDCGGVHGYELIAGATDPDHPQHAQLAVEFADLYGDEVDPGEFELVPFDLDAINRELERRDLTPTPGAAPVSGPLAELLAHVYALQLRRRLFRLIVDGDLDRTVQPDPDTAARMTAPYRWLLERVGDDGITLTEAGYLPPVHVRAAVDELGLDAVWIGAGNREHDTVPVLALRKSAQDLGLLRKHRGRLLTTARGRAVTGDPAALWYHLAERMPLGSRDDAARQAGLVLLLAVAAGSTDGVDALAADVLTARGWTLEGRRPLDAPTAGRLLWDNVAMLRRTGALTSTADARWPGEPTPEGIAFARAALTSWPAR